MRVTVDGYWWTGGPPSGRNVAQSMILAWLESFPEDDVTVMCRQADVEILEERLNPWSGRVRLSPTKISNHQLAVLSASVRGDAIVTHNFSPLRRRGAVCAVFVHDLIFRDHPEWFTLKERAYLSTLTASAKRADVVLTSSVSEAERIARYLPRSNIQSVGLAVSTGYATAVEVAPADAPKGEYLLTVGRLNIRKNLARLIDALHRDGIISVDLPLVIVGESAGRGEEFSDVGKAVIWAGRVTDGELKWLYSRADCFIFPSLDEGFGLPMIEAAQAGVPIAASDIPAFRGFDLPIEFFDPTDLGSMAGAVRNARDRNERTVAAAVPTWGDVVSRMRANIEKV